jgi:hypothetical protein
LHAQRIEVHFNKDFSTNSIANKGLGVGGAVDLDQWVKNTTFRFNFNWLMYKKSDEINHNYQKLSGGFSSFYTFAWEKFSLQCGAEINFTNLKHTYRYGTVEIDSLHSKYVNLQENGNFIGIGPHIGARYELSPRFSIVFNFIPTYLIRVQNKMNSNDHESTKGVIPEYSKGFWIFPMQLGISFKLFNSE